MSEERLKEIKKMVKEKGLKIYCSDFTKSEIADKLGLSIDAIKYHRRKVSLLLRQTCCRIFL